MPKALQENAKQRKIQILITILFSLVTVITSFMTDMVYVPIAPDKVIDLTIVSFIFAVMIGGYWAALPLALVWSVATRLNVDPLFVKWAFWQMVLIRTIFAFGLVWAYQTARRMYPMSPLNVYRGMIGGLLIKAIAGLPFDMMTRGSLHGAVLRIEIFVLEAALSSVFMALLIKHLREIHILNGVKKKKRG